MIRFVFLVVMWFTGVETAYAAFAIFQLSSNAVTGSLLLEGSSDCLLIESSSDCVGVQGV